MEIKRKFVRKYQKTVSKYVINYSDCKILIENESDYKIQFSRFVKLLCQLKHAFKLRKVTMN